jgi:hypothetical protein
LRASLLFFHSPFFTTLLQTPIMLNRRQQSTGTAPAASTNAPAGKRHYSFRALFG